MCEEPNYPDTEEFYYDFLDQHLEDFGWVPCDSAHGCEGRLPDGSRTVLGQGRTKLEALRDAYKKYHRLIGQQEE